MGLRARLTITFGVTTLFLSVLMGGFTYFSARYYLINARQASDLHQSYADASLVQADLLPPNASVTSVMQSLRSGTGARYLILRNGQWFTSSLSVDQSAIPVALRRDVLRGQPATQRSGLSGSPQFVVGLPLPSVKSYYFETFSLSDLNNALNLLALILTVAVILTALAGAATGRWAARRALRPLTNTSRVAVAIAHGSLDTRLATGRDRDLARLSASFNEMADTLQDRIQREVRFTSDVSHELRSPLTTLLNTVEVLEAGSAGIPDRQRHAVRLLASEVRSFSRIVQELIEISRLDSAAEDLLLEPTDVHVLVQQASRLPGTDSPRCDIDPGLGGTRVLVDRRRIERVLANLVDNANLYAGGVTEISARAAGPHLQIRISDHGPGIAPDERERIFERFYRGKTAGKRGETRGTGLGLALATEHVRLHGGRIFVDGGNGSNSFVVEIPLQPADGTKPSPLPSASTETRLLSRLPGPRHGKETVHHAVARITGRQEADRS